MRIENHRLLGQAYRESPNRGGVIVPELIVMHFTGSFSASDAIDRLCDPDSGNPVSAHVVLDRDGAITQLAPFNIKAWHAGESVYETPERTFVGLNAHAIGIEIVNPGWFTKREDGVLLHEGAKPCLEKDLQTIPAFIEQPLKDGSIVCWAAYPEAQLTALESLTHAILSAYPGIGYVVGHEDVAPGRKVDPGPAFPMARFQRLVAAAASQRENSSNG